jgi:hypothetical protein
MIRGLIQFENRFNFNTESMKDYGTNGFYMSQGFQWYIICNFSMYGLEVMNFQIFSTNLIQISVLKSV